jgi:hypothetical protein
LKLNKKKREKKEEKFKLKRKKDTSHLPEKLNQLLVKSVKRMRENL